MDQRRARLGPADLRVGGLRARRRGAPFALRAGDRRPRLAPSPRRIVLGPLRRAPARRRRGPRGETLEHRYSPTRAYRPKRAPRSEDEHDACALYAWIAKDAQPAHEPIPAAIEALEQMLHRAGSVDGEGDGCGVLLDIPRELWSEEVRRGGHISKLALDPNFTVLHLFIPRAAEPEERQGPRPRAAEQVRAAHPGRAPRRGRVQRAGPHRARGGAALLADRRRDRRPAADLRAEDPARVRAGPARGQLLHRHRRLQGARRPAGARRLLPRPARPAREDHRGLRPQPLLDQDLARAQARPALRRARPQRRDQHDRPAAPGGQDDRRPARRGDVGLRGPQPHGRVADQPRRPHAGRGARADAAPDRQRDQGHARGAARLLHVPAPGLRPLRPGPGRAGVPPRRRVRVRGRRARAAAAVAPRDLRGPRLLLRARGRGGGGHHRRAQAVRAGREAGGADRPREGRVAAARPPPPAAAVLRALARAHRRRRPRRRLPARAPGGRPAGGRGDPRLLQRRPGRAGAGGVARAGRLRLAARGHAPGAADGQHRRRADQLAGLRRPARRAVARAPEPGRLLQGVGGGGHQPGHRPRARGRALLLPRRDGPAARPARRSRTTSTRWRPPSR